MSICNQRTHPSLTRRTLLRSVLALPLAAMLVACSNRDQSGDLLPSVSYDTLPEGLGRGFPLATLAGADNSATGIDKGASAPNFRLQLDDDQGLYLSDLVGRPILINFWATWCGPCRLEMPELVAHANQSPDLIVLAINVQEQLEPIAAFASDFSMTMPVVRDEDAKVRDLYKVGGMPTSVFIDREGKISTYWMGVMSPSKLDELVSAIL